MTASSPRVVALGGAFLFSERPQALADWYTQQLGLAFEHSADYGAWFARFDYRTGDGGPEPAGTARYALFSVLTTERRPQVEGKLVTVNLRVHDLPALVQRLRAASWDVTDMDEHPEGRFAWTHDPDGNRLELWEDTSAA